MIKTLFRLVIQKQRYVIPILGVTFAVVIFIAPHMVEAGWISIPNAIVNALLLVTQAILGIFSLVVNFIIKICLWLLAPLLTTGSFITHPFVRAGWPFIQGIANIGFILTLLYLAFATTLGIDTANLNVYKVLPRLVFAALLINFSLVITGVILDLTRILMAIMIRIMSGASDTLSAQILQSSALLPLVNKVTTDLQDALWTTELGGFARTAGSFMALVFKLMLAVALVSLIAGLFVRYVALLLLLIASPLAFLAFVLPNTETYAKQWWTTFLKYAFYGPIALFILMLTSRIGNLIKLDLPPDAGSLQIFVQSAMSLCVTMAMLFAAAKSGSYFGIAGANAVTGWAQKRATGFGKAALGTAGALGGATWLRNQARDAGKEAIKPVQYQLGLGKFSKYDEKGNLKPGKSSWLASRTFSRLNNRLTGNNPLTGNALYQPAQDRFNDQEDVRTALGGPGGWVNVGNIDHDAFSPTQLAKGHVVSALGANTAARVAQVQRIIRLGTQAQRMAIVRNKDFLRDPELTAADITSFQNTIRDGVAAGTITRDQAEKSIDRLLQTIEDIKKE